MRWGGVCPSGVGWSGLGCNVMQWDGCDCVESCGVPQGAALAQERQKVNSSGWQH